MTGVDGRLLSDGVLRDADGRAGVDRAPREGGERLSGELVRDGEEPEQPAVAGLVELEVERPDVVGVLGRQTRGRGAESPTRLRFFEVCRTRRPSSRQRRWMRRPGRCG